MLTAIFFFAAIHPLEAELTSELPFCDFDNPCPDFQGNRSQVDICNWKLGKSEAAAKEAAFDSLDSDLGFFAKWGHCSTAKENLKAALAKETCPKDCPESTKVGKCMWQEGFKKANIDTFCTVVKISDDETQNDAYLKRCIKHYTTQGKPQDEAEKLCKDHIKNKTAEALYAAKCCTWVFVDGKKICDDEDKKPGKECSMYDDPDAALFEAFVSEYGNFIRVTVDSNQPSGSGAGAVELQE